MRRLAISILFVAFLLSTPARGDDFAWEGRGTIHLAVPAGWKLASKEVGPDGYAFKAEPAKGPPMVVRLTLAWMPAGSPLRGDTLKTNLKEVVQPHLSGSVEKRYDPRPLSLTGGTGWYVQLTDASLVGKPPQPDNLKVMRNAVALLGEKVLVIATIQFDDATAPSVSEAMSLVSSVRVDSSKAAPERARNAGGPYEFTIPQSRVAVRVPEMGLRPDGDDAPGPNYFKLSRDEPQLILSGWLEPASQYQGLKSFWELERKSPAYAGAMAPTRVEMVKVGPWEVIAFDVPLAGGTSAHLRAERVLAGTWIDLHLSTTSARPAATLREELVAALGRIEVVEKAR